MKYPRASPLARFRAAVAGRTVSPQQLNGTRIPQRVLPRAGSRRLGQPAATIIRKQLGLEAARALLGQRSLAIADTCAELDQALAIDAARKLGQM